jgi:hypothetical protein
MTIVPSPLTPLASLFGEAMLLLRKPSPTVPPACVQRKACS